MIGDSVAIVGPIRNRAVSVEQNTPQRNPLVCRRKVSNNPQFGSLAKLPVVFFFRPVEVATGASFLKIIFKN